MDEATRAVETVMERAWADEDYRRRLYLDPVGIVSDLGLATEIRDQVIAAVQDSFEPLLMDPPFPLGGGDDAAGVREPRRPKPYSGVGGAEVDDSTAE